MNQGDLHLQSTINMQTAVGVVLLSVAAAAVFWKVKPEWGGGWLNSGPIRSRFLFSFVGVDDSCTLFTPACCNTKKKKLDPTLMVNTYSIHLYVELRIPPSLETGTTLWIPPWHFNIIRLFFLSADSFFFPNGIILMPSFVFLMLGNLMSKCGGSDLLWWEIGVIIGKMCGLSLGIFGMLEAKARALYLKCLGCMYRALARPS